jgi:hypothetical protein
MRDIQPTKSNLACLRIESIEYGYDGSGIGVGLNSAETALIQGSAHLNRTNRGASTPRSLATTACRVRVRRDRLSCMPTPTSGQEAAFTSRLLPDAVVVPIEHPNMLQSWGCERGAAGFPVHRPANFSRYHARAQATQVAIAQVPPERVMRGSLG